MENHGKEMSNKFFGVDGEMTTAELESGGRLIQIGVTADVDPQGNPLEGSFAYTAFFNPGEDFAWSDRAEAVHGFTKNQVKAARPASEVDDELVEWLLANGADSSYRGNIIPVGFNIGAFDMPYIKQTLPKTYARLSHRTVDLNALTYALDGKVYGNNREGYDGNAWKSNAKTYAERMIAKLTEGRNVKAAHDAGYDALLHLHVWRFLKAAIVGEALPMPQNVVPMVKSQVMAIALLQAFGADRASEKTGVPHDFLIGWSQGGRALNSNYLASLTAVYNDITNMSLA